MEKVWQLPSEARVVWRQNNDIKSHNLGDRRAMSNPKRLAKG